MAESMALAWSSVRWGSRRGSKSSSVIHGPRVVREVPRPGPDLGPDAAGDRRDGHGRHRGDDHVAGPDGADRLDQLGPLGREVRGPEHGERGRGREPFVDGQVQVVGRAPADVQVDHRAEGVVGAEHDDQGLDPGLTAGALLAEGGRGLEDRAGRPVGRPRPLRDHEAGPVVVALDDLVDDVVARRMGGDAGLEPVGVQRRGRRAGPSRRRPGCGRPGRWAAPCCPAPAPSSPRSCPCSCGAAGRSRAPRSS